MANIKTAAFASAFFEIVKTAGIVEIVGIMCTNLVGQKDFLTGQNYYSAAKMVEGMNSAMATHSSIPLVLPKLSKMLKLGHDGLPSVSS